MISAYRFFGVQIEKRDWRENQKIYVLYELGYEYKKSIIEHRKK